MSLLLKRWIRSVPLSVIYSDLMYNLANMAYDIISKLSDPSSESKIELLEYLIGQTKREQSNESFKSKISSYLHTTEKVPYLATYCQIGPKYALGCLLGHFIYHYIGISDLNTQASLLTSLLTFTKDFRPSKAALLKKTNTIKLLNTLSDWGFPDYRLRSNNNTPLRIFYIPYEHWICNKKIDTWLSCLFKNRITKFIRCHITQL